MRTLDRGLEQLLTIDLRSLYALAHKIFEGKDIQQDYQKACRLFCIAALRGETRALYRLGLMNLHAHGRVRNRLRAFMWLNLAAGFGAAEAALDVRRLDAELSHAQHDKAKKLSSVFLKAKECFEIAQRGEDGKAMNDIGEMFMHADGLEQDFDLAIAWFRSAIRQDYAEAYYNLGYATEHGRGVHQDLDAAIILYNQASDRGSVNAQYQLACLIERGAIPRMRPGLAIGYYESAAEQGHLAAQLRAGEWFKFLDEPDHPAHTPDLSEQKRNDLTLGIATRKHSKNMMKAYVYYSMAAAQGDAGAECQVGLMAAQGQGIAQNFTLAAEWFLMAAKKGNAQAQFNLGFLYSHGQGVDEDFIEAYKWYKISDACGYIYAKDSMALLSSKMDEVDVEMADWRGANFLHAFVKEQADENLIS